MQVGIPVAPISVAYAKHYNQAKHESGRDKLAYLLDLLTPGAIAYDASIHPDSFTDASAAVRIALNTLGESAGRAAGWRNIALILGHWQLRGYGQWTVVEKATGDVVGRVGLWYPEGWPGVELGWLIRRSCWNRGFATEACGAAIEFAFGACGLPHIISMIRIDNTRSVRVAEKLGLTLERTLVVKGGDVLVYGMRPSAETTPARAADPAQASLAF